MLNLKEIALAIAKIQTAKVSILFLCFFLRVFAHQKITIKRKHIFRSPCNLAHRKGVQR